MEKNCGAHRAIPPTCAAEVLLTNIWWSTSFIGSNFNFSVDRVRALTRAWLRSIRDLWDYGTIGFKTWEVIEKEFPFSSCSETTSLVPSYIPNPGEVAPPPY